MNTVAHMGMTRGRVVHKHTYKHIQRKTNDKKGYAHSPVPTNNRFIHRRQWAQWAQWAPVEVDTALIRELEDNGFRSTRRTKLIMTIGPATEDKLLEMAKAGMNVARLNMCHGSREWHKDVIKRIRKLNEDLGYSVAIMIDTEGSEVHIGDLNEPFPVEEGDNWTFTVRSIDVQQGGEKQSNASAQHKISEVSYEGFTEDVKVGDIILTDGGMVKFTITAIEGPDVQCTCIEPGLLLPRANLTFRRSGRLVRARNAMLPTISAKDWVDIDFAIENGADLIAISFVKTAETVNHLKSYLSSKCSPLGADDDVEVEGEGGVSLINKKPKIPGVVSKLESFDCIPNMDEIVEASDAVMVARGDLGAQVPLADIPVIQQEITRTCRKWNKPCIVASHLLRSMLEHPTPTRAEVADIADAVRQKADALMLSGESAAGLYPMRSLDVLRTVATQTEQYMHSNHYHSRASGAPKLDDVGSHKLMTYTSEDLNEREIVSEGLCASAAQLADNLKASAIFVFTKRGYMASLISRCRPECPIFAFTDGDAVRRRMNLLWGVMPFRIDLYRDNPEMTVERTFRLLLTRGLIKEGDMVVVVSDIGPVVEEIRSIQVRYVKDIQNQQPEQGN